MHSPPKSTAKSLNVTNALIPTAAVGRPEILGGA